MRDAVTTQTPDIYHTIIKFVLAEQNFQDDDIKKEKIELFFYVVEQSKD